MNNIKENILLVITVVCYIVFFGSMLFAVLYPCGSPETKTALYIGLGSFLAGLAAWGLGLLND